MGSSQKRFGRNEKSELSEYWGLLQWTSGHKTFHWGDVGEWDVRIRIYWGR